MEPRDRVAAGRMLGTVGAVAAVVTVGFEVFALSTGRVGNSMATLFIACGIALFLLAAGVCFWRYPDRIPRPAYLGIALFGIAVMLWVGLGTRDASAAGQIGFIYPVVFAGSQLRPLLACLVAAAAVAADAVVVFALLPVPVATADVLVVGAGIGMLTLVLVAAGRYQDQLVARLAALAATDPLTGLATRRELEAAVRFEAERRRSARRVPGPGTGLLVIDLDRFGLLNELYGHPVGDEALVHVGGVVVDALPQTATVARIGGDELAVLLPRAGRQDVRDGAEAVLAAVTRSPLPGDHGGIPLSVSIGMTHSTGTVAELADLYVPADAALFRAKAEGRGRVAVS